MECEYLKNSDEIRKKIAHLFDTADPKVAIVAFVGSSAIEYIPNCNNLQVYCWPLPGATSANGIRLLQQKGVKVFFSDNMHKKIYWAKGNGAVVASANLTYNGLSGKELQESGVFIPADKFDIDAEINNLKSIRLAGRQEIEDLERKSRIFGSIVHSTNNKVISFREFMELPYRPKIKILSYCEEREKETIKEIKENIKKEQKLNTVELVNDNDVKEVTCFDAGDIILQVKTFNDDDIIHGKNMHPLTWLFVDVTTYSEDAESYLVAQIKPNREIPFNVGDIEFISAFKSEFNTTDWKDIKDKYCNVKESFWKKVLNKMDK